MADKSSAIAKKNAKGALKKQAKKAAKNATKHSAKKHANKKSKKAAKRVATARTSHATDYGLMTAFHHMQRAAVVMSLMEEGTGEDLRDLLERGVKLYRKAVEDDAGEKIILRAIGVLRATEHLSMAGLYAAREKHRQQVATPTPE
jgi:hypothetical protein